MSTVHQRHGQTDRRTDRCAVKIAQDFALCDVGINRASPDPVENYIIRQYSPKTNIRSAPHGKWNQITWARRRRRILLVTPSSGEVTDSNSGHAHCTMTAVSLTYRQSCVYNTLLYLECFEKLFRRRYKIFNAMQPLTLLRIKRRISGWNDTIQ